jgi:hypothetical protein
VAWYVSRTIRLGDHELAVEGEDPWNAYALEPGFMGEQARWWLDLQRKRYHRQFMRSFWSALTMPVDSRVSRLRYRPIPTPTAAERAAARVLAAWVLWSVLRARIRGSAAPGRAGG